MAIAKTSRAPISVEIDTGLNSAFWFMGASLIASTYFSLDDGLGERRTQGPTF
ncbi:hypothetical protein G8O24_29135 [Bradyrhizobium sp. INPA01-394B]|uniref:Uncharacterized protein n=1 Tax=Bradyrhizobium campsiandrae TaxID=1729892 RepID=A0ABR7U6L6_9BRAD|nr:hypothetical protein [Bradyrhizobium campsiandrae]MBC9881395.1 hypothetical protein [Bradyrhizobium campsiandrae]MBC9979064.1 hypothetical protein [Bradyrhizobium campsiandrae]